MSEHVPADAGLVVAKVRGGWRVTDTANDVCYSMNRWGIVWYDAPTQLLRLEHFKEIEFADSEITRRVRSAVRAAGYRSHLTHDGEIVFDQRLPKTGD